MLKASLNVRCTTKCYVNVTKFFHKNISAKRNEFHRFRQLLPISPGIGNGYSDSFERVRKLFHLDILQK